MEILNRDLLLQFVKKCSCNERVCVRACVCMRACV